MSGELFPIESVAMDSPRLAWLKANNVETQYVPNGDEWDDKPFWVCRVKREDKRLFWWYEIAQGETEEEACALYAKNNNIKTWNE